MAMLTLPLVCVRIWRQVSSSVEAHLLQLGELFSVFFPGWSGVGLLNWGAKSLAAHELLQQCGVDSSEVHASHSSHAAHSREGVGLLLSALAERCGLSWLGWLSWHLASWHRERTRLASHGAHTSHASSTSHHGHGGVHVLGSHHLPHHVGVGEDLSHLRIRLGHLSEHGVALDHLLHECGIR